MPQFLKLIWIKMCSGVKCSERRLQIKCTVIILQEYCLFLPEFLMATLKVSGRASGVLVFLVMTNADLLALLLGGFPSKCTLLQIISIFISQVKKQAQAQIMDEQKVSLGCCFFSGPRM